MWVDEIIHFWTVCVFMQEKEFNFLNIIFKIFITTVSFGEYHLYCPVYNYRV